jgi:DNA-binding transcriptional regulator PaaX
MFRVICVNDSGRPAMIAPENWIKKDRVYTVVELYQGWADNEEGYILEEVTPKSAGYEGYKASRFKPFEEMTDEALEELLEECFSPQTVN